MPVGVYERRLKPKSERFAAQVWYDPTSGCHLWGGCRDSNGYGRIRTAGVTEYAHRVAWELAHGYAPDTIAHQCDNTSCVNVDHLDNGTQGDNLRGGIARGRLPQLRSTHGR